MVPLLPNTGGAHERKNNTELRFHNTLYEGFSSAGVSKSSDEDFSPWQKESSTQRYSKAKEVTSALT